jgi:hypothetical protein
MYEPKTTVPFYLKLAVYIMFALALGMGIFLTVGIVKARRFNLERNARLEAAGYEKIETQIDVIVTNPPTKPTWYIGKSITLLNGSDASIAMTCATGEIRGTVKGDVTFIGIPLSHPVLIIQTNAEITGNLETTCWMVKNFGTLRGQLIGTRNFYVTNMTPMTAPQK